MAALRQRHAIAAFAGERVTAHEFNVSAHFGICPLASCEQRDYLAREVYLIGWLSARTEILVLRAAVRGPLAVQGIPHMRKMIFAAAIAGAALSLSACSSKTEDAAATTADSAATDAAAGATDAAMAASTAATDAAASASTAAAGAATAASTAATDAAAAASGAAADASMAAEKKM